MSKAHMGARVLYCGHAGYFVADIFEIEGVNVVRANTHVTADNIIRHTGEATHHLQDFPTAGFWRPDLGVFVAPKTQVRKL